MLKYFKSYVHLSISCTKYRNEFNSHDNSYQLSCIGDSRYLSLYHLNSSRKYYSNSNYHRVGHC